MRKTTKDIKISLNVSFKGCSKGVFPTFYLIKVFILKFAKKKKKKNTIFYPKIKESDIFTSKVVSGLPTVKKKHRESLTCYHEMHILQIIRCLWGTFNAF